MGAFSAGSEVVLVALDGCDASGVWEAHVPGEVSLVVGPELVPVVWLEQRGARSSELMVELEVQNGRVGDQVRWELVAQPRREGGGGVVIVGGMLTLTKDGARSPFLVGYGRGPAVSSWGLRARLVAVGSGEPSRMLRWRISGWLSEGERFSALGEGVVP